ncbi:hypothetical protein DVH24_026567 [Malus domestica]|uniref:Uncharacterized protein n=1 Tax=Malus domestica TaxID=3750 RepID=A0A498KQ05_MALDO|nr:hypothetical protein DVH24_026567 [Malus domestica]
MKIILNKSTKDQEPEPKSPKAFLAIFGRSQLGMGLGIFYFDPFMASCGQDNFKEALDLITRSTSNPWENFEGRQWNSMPAEESSLKKKAICDNTKQCRIRSKARS